MDNDITILLRRIIGNFKEEGKKDYFELTKNIFHLFGIINHGIVNTIYEEIRTANPNNIFLDGQNQTIKIVGGDEVTKTIMVSYDVNKKCFSMDCIEEYYVNDEIAASEDDAKLREKLKSQIFRKYEYNKMFPNELALSFLDSSYQLLKSSSKTIYSFKDNGELETIEKEIDGTYDINLKLDYHRIAREYYKLKRQQLIINTKEEREKDKLIQKYNSEGDILSIENLFLDENGIYDSTLEEEYYRKNAQNNSILDYFNENILYCLDMEQQLGERRQLIDDICYEITTYDENGQPIVTKVKSKRKI